MWIVRTWQFFLHLSCWFYCEINQASWWSCSRRGLWSKSLSNHHQLSFQASSNRPNFRSSWGILRRSWRHSFSYRRVVSRIPFQHAWHRKSEWGAPSLAGSQKQYSYPNVTRASWSWGRKSHNEQHAAPSSAQAHSLHPDGSPASLESFSQWMLADSCHHDFPSCSSWVIYTFSPNRIQNRHFLRL